MGTCVRGPSVVGKLAVRGTSVGEVDRFREAPNFAGWVARSPDPVVTKKTVKLLLKKT